MSPTTKSKMDTFDRRPSVPAQVQPALWWVAELHALVLHGGRGATKDRERASHHFCLHVALVSIESAELQSLVVVVVCRHIDYQQDSHKDSYAVMPALYHVLDHSCSRREATESACKG